jgi:uncharacterized protein YciI
MKHYLLFYAFVDDYLERRTLFRDAHLRHAWEGCTRSGLMLGGAVGTPPEGGLLLFRADSVEPVEAFARRDPYVVNGVVSSWRIREWTTVVGDLAQSPAYPEGFQRPTT